MLHFGKTFVCIGEKTLSLFLGKRWSAFSLFLLAVPCLGAQNVGRSQTTATDASLTVAASYECRPYSPMIFGGFIEHFHRQVYGGIYAPGSPLSDEMGFRKDVLAALRELRIPVVRWPGGCFVDGYHWQKAVGAERQPMDDIRWGVREPNTFGTAEFVEFCRRLGAAPYICHNGLADIQEMADWVAYCNQTEGEWAQQRKKDGAAAPYGVKFWSVGNERGGKAYIDRVRDGAKAMKKIDSTVLVTCSGTHGAGRVDPYLFETAGDVLDYISIHQYWIQNFQEFHTPDYLQCILLSAEPERFIHDVVQSLEQNGRRGKIKLAFDEWNLRSWHHPGFPRNQKADYDDAETQRLISDRDKSLNNQIYTMADALFSASFFNACLRYSDEVTMANIAPMVNQTGPLYADEYGVVRRPHFYTMQLYANELEKYVVDALLTSDSLTDGQRSVPTVDALVTNSGDGQWVVSLVNRDPEQSKTCRLQLGDLLPHGRYQALVLCGDAPDAYNDREHPDRVVPENRRIRIRRGIVTLPPHSLTLVRIPDSSAAE